MEQISRIGMDTPKHFFQLHGVNAAGKAVLRKKLRRKEMVAFFEALAAAVIGIEACGASHHWARILRPFGHAVKLIAPQLVKPYGKRGKNDTAGTEALCEGRPAMRFVPVKTTEQQAALKMCKNLDLIHRSRSDFAIHLMGRALSARRERSCQGCEAPASPARAKLASLTESARSPNSPP